MVLFGQSPGANPTEFHLSSMEHRAQSSHFLDSACRTGCGVRMVLALPTELRSGNSFWAWLLCAEPDARAGVCGHVLSGTIPSVGSFRISGAASKHGAGGRRFGMACDWRNVEAL